MALHLVTGPAPVVPLAEMKEYLRVDFEDNDALIAASLAAATAHLDGRDGWLGRALGYQVWEFRLGGFYGAEIKIPLPPMIALESVTYIGAAGVMQTLDPDFYEVAGLGGFGKARLVLRSGKRWPAVTDRAEGVVIRFSCGYLDNGSPPVGEVPAPIVEAIKRLTATLFDGRENVEVGGGRTKINWAADALLAPYRVLT